MESFHLCLNQNLIFKDISSICKSFHQVANFTCNYKSKYQKLICIFIENFDWIWKEQLVGQNWICIQICFYYAGDEVKWFNGLLIWEMTDSSPMSICLLLLVVLHLTLADQDGEVDESFYSCIPGLSSSAGGMMHICYFLYIVVQLTTVPSRQTGKFQSSM
jgi:hypothetical protein